MHASATGRWILECLLFDVLSMKATATLRSFRVQCHMRGMLYSAALYNAMLPYVLLYVLFSA